MALTFFWRAEATTLDGTDDFSAGDTTASLAGSATLSSTAARIGTNGVLGVASLASSANFSPASIFPGTTTAPSDSVGAMALSYQFKGAVPSGGAPMLRFRGTSGSDVIAIETSGSTQLRLNISNAGSGATLDTTTLTTAIDTWYGIVVRWDIPNNKRKIEVYNASNALLEAVEDTSTNISAAIPSEVNNLLQCGIKTTANANATWADCFMVGNTYAEPLQNNLTISSYTQYVGSLAPIRLIWRV